MENSLETTKDTINPKGKGKAIAALVLGIISLPGAILPIIGLPISIVGLIMGILGRKSSKKGIAVAGIILSAIGLLLTIVNAVMGAIMAIQGIHPFVQ